MSSEDNEEKEAVSGDDKVNYSLERPDKVAENSRGIISQTIGMFAGSTEDSLSDRITEEHITAILENDARETEADQKYRASNRYFILVYVIIAVIVFAGLTYFLAQHNTELYIKILSHVGALVAGFAAGWGFHKARE